MSAISRRTMLRSGLTVAAGVAGVAVGARLAEGLGLMPPDGVGIYGPGETLTFAAQRLLIGDAPAREFPRSMISSAPFANELAPPTEEFRRLQAGGFADWRLAVGGMVERPTAFSLAELRAMPQGSHITQLACEEGWSYIAEWSGTPLADVLKAVGPRPGARYVAYYSTDPNWWETIDLAEAVHPQTLVATGMNGGHLPVPFGGPLRVRVPRQLGYKSVKFVTRIDVVDSVRDIGKGLGGMNPDGGYAWFAGI
jgi:DMSO/TMAO reductase YedYZ molybdopterin-dependent catalytic subunit